MRRSSVFLWVAHLVMVTDMTHRLGSFAGLGLVCLSERLGRSLHIKQVG